MAALNPKAQGFDRIRPEQQNASTYQTLNSQARTETSLRDVGDGAGELARGLGLRVPMGFRGRGVELAMS